MRQLASTGQLATLQELGAGGIAALEAPGAYLGGELGADWFAAAARLFGDAQEELGAGAYPPLAAWEAYPGGELGADWFAAAAHLVGGVQEPLMRRFGDVVQDRPMIGDADAAQMFGGAQELLMRQLGGVAVNLPMIGNAEAVRAEHELGAARGLVADVAAAYEAAAFVRGGKEATFYVASIPPSQVWQSFV